MSSCKKIIVSDLNWGNVGCQIILRGSVNFLKFMFPNYELTFYVPSHNPSHDETLFKDVENIKIIPMIKWRRYVRGLMKKTGLYRRFWIPRFDSKYFREADLFLSVGGDIYTMFSDKIPDDWVGYETYASKHKIPSVMLGANMERFEVLPASEKAFLIRHLKRFQRLFVRDVKTKNYLLNNGIENNVIFLPDPVFSYRQVTMFHGNKIKKIGLNFTPILIQHYGPSIIEQYCEIIMRLLDCGYEVYLIPHVESLSGNPDIRDQSAIDKISALLPARYSSRVKIFQGKTNLAEVSEFIDKVDLVVAARMHCSLNALTLGKPVIFLGYSLKSEAIVETLRTDMPFASVSETFVSVDAEKLNVEFISMFISQYETWKQGQILPITIDTSLFHSEIRSGTNITLKDENISSTHSINETGQQPLNG